MRTVGLIQKVRQLQTRKQMSFRPNLPDVRTHETFALSVSSTAKFEFQSQTPNWVLDSDSNSI